MRMSEERLYRWLEHLLRFGQQKTMCDRFEKYKIPTYSTTTTRSMNKFRLSKHFTFLDNMYSNAVEILFQFCLE